MNGSAGSSRPKRQKQELAGSNGAVPASETESEDPVVGLAVRIVEINHFTYLTQPAHVRFGSLAEVEARLAMRPLFPKQQTSLGAIGTSV